MHYAAQRIHQLTMEGREIPYSMSSLARPWDFIRKQGSSRGTSSGGTTGR